MVDGVPVGGIKLVNPWGKEDVDPLLYGFTAEVLKGWYEFTNPILSGPPAP